MPITRAWIDEHCGDTTCIDGPMMFYGAEALANELIEEWESTGEQEIPNAEELTDALYCYSHGMLA